MYPRLSREIVDSAIKYSAKYDLSPILVLAIIETESKFYPFALSKQNAKGLMQINPDANQQLLLQEGIFKEPADIFDPERNIEAGCFLLRRFINESPDFNTALDKYLGADSVPYKAQIHGVMGKILLLGITEELNGTSHKISPVVKVEPRATKN
ncbi:MAG TPA: transglycosylase SLT domain-containing protein [Saprospiraceae bacterium]|nr:transglycosylase SLT domain-containing protein [Saprospiraceae bacterium]